MREAIVGGHSSAKGPFSARCAEILRDELDAADVLMTTSCTAALELAGLMLDIEPGDTVIVPSFTFVTTALAFARAGARLVFADIEEETLGIDPRHISDLIDDRTRAVVPVHYAGVASDVDGLRAVIGDRPIDIIEDNAHGLFASIGDRPLGSLGRFSTLSFHETKNFVCGEGGALVVNDRADVDRAHTVYDKGTNRREFMLGQVDKYSWVDVGSSFGLSDILAAYLLAQLEERGRVLALRRAVFERYNELLEPMAAEFGFRVPSVPADREQGYHMFYLLMPDRNTRDHTLRYLNDRDIRATFHYVPLHDAPGAQIHVDRPTECPVTTDVSGRLIRLPFFNELDLGTVERIAMLVGDALRSRRP